MKLPKILVTAACGDLGSSTIRSLASEGYPIIGTDIKTKCPVAEYIECMEVVPHANDNKYGDYLLSICKKYNINVIVPCSEVEIQFLNKNRDKFNNKSIFLLINNQKIIDIFSDKYKTIFYLSSLGISTPKTLLLSEYTSNFNLPAIVKPRNGSGGCGIQKVDDIEFVLYLKRRYGSAMIIQEIVGCPDEEYTTGIYSDGIKTSSITFQRVLAPGGYSQEVKLVNDINIDTLATHISHSINLIGSINLQTRKVGNKYLPFEINPRISSTVMFRNLAGFKDVHWWIRHLLYGDTYNFIPPTEFVGVRCLSEKIF